MAVAATQVIKDKTDLNVNYEPAKIKSGEYEMYKDYTLSVDSQRSTFAINTFKDAKRKETVHRARVLCPFYDTAEAKWKLNWALVEFHGADGATDVQLKELTHRTGSVANLTVLRDMVEYQKYST